jgi:1-acyl-sn-glycerol-3-phosphate acyltransferase
VPASRAGSSAERRPFLYWVLAGIVSPLTSIFAKIRIEGAENLPRDGAYVLTPNHYSEFDPLIVAVAVWRIGRPPRFMAKESLFRVPVLGWALKSTGMVPVARSSSAASARNTLTLSEALVAQGRGLVVYVEGSLTRDPAMWPMRGKTGAARLALAADIPVYPMAHWGAQEIMPRYGKLRFWPLRRPVTVVIGPRVDLSDLVARSPQPAALSAATTRIMDAIAQLLADIRGIPAPSERWDPSMHGQQETGRLEP